MLKVLQEPELFSTVSFSVPGLLFNQANQTNTILLACLNPIPIVWSPGCLFCAEIQQRKLAGSCSCAGRQQKWGGNRDTDRKLFGRREATRKPVVKVSREGDNRAGKPAGSRRGKNSFSLSF